MEEITCVQFFTMAHYSAMSDAEIEALPPRWCLMRAADMGKAGWVAQRYLIAEGYEPVATPAADTDEAPGGEMIREAHDPANAGIFFSADVVAAMQATPLQADPIYGAHDFGGSVSVPSPDPHTPFSAA
ncbi:hypothetical protein E0K89_019495 [Aquicoccus sp. SCR17]|nr:hypothetical protein [Carideicomes alvinocaridis]